MVLALRLNRVGLLALLLFGAALALSFNRLTADGTASEEAPPEPLPLRRVLLPAERLPAEMQRAKEGLLVQLPRSDFEERLKNATLAGQNLKQPPRLIEARYQRVRLKDNALIGSAEWKVHNPTTAPGLLALQPTNVALRQLRWSDGKSALLGDLDGKELSLLVEGSGDRSLFLEWSARGTPASVGLRFSLDLPPCAVATLELELHKDFAVALSRDAGLVTGPHAAEAPDHQMWRLAFAGRNQLTFEVRRTHGPDLPTPLVLGRLQSVQELKPGQVNADFDFALEVLHGTVTELRCECSPELRPYEVNVRNLDNWKLLPGKGGNAPVTLVIQFREPFEGGAVQVRCLAPLPADRAWVSPGLRLPTAVWRGETLELRVDPELQMEEWKPAGFRLLRTSFQPDGKQVLQLAAGLDGGVNPERPSARFPVARPEFRVRQWTWWQIGPDRPTLTAQLTYDVSRGRLFRLPVQLPAGWDVDLVEVAPTDLLQHSTVTPDKANPSLVVDLERGLEPGTTARLTIRLRAKDPLRVPAAGASLPFPDVVPSDARLREGAFAISIAPLFHGKATASVAAAAPEAAGEVDAGGAGGEVADARPKPASGTRVRPPWGKHLPEFFFPFKGQAVEGTLQLRPRPTQLRARCQSDVVLASSRAVALVRLELVPEVGTPQAVDLFIAGPSVGRWDWQTVRGGNAVKRVERLPGREIAGLLDVMAAPAPLHAAALAALQPRGSWWRLTFARPLTESVILETSVELPGEGPLEPSAPARAAALLSCPHPLGALGVAAVAGAAGPPANERRWEVPLVLVPKAERRDGRVTLHLTGADLVHVEAHGLQEITDATPREMPTPHLTPAPAASWRTFRYGTPLGLTLRGQAPVADRSTEAVIDRAVLTSYLGAGRLLHQFRFQVWNWRQQTLPVRLPAGVELLAARTDGHSLHQLSPTATADGQALIELPVVGTSLLHRFEIVYATPAPAWRLWSRLTASAPSLPLQPLAFRRTWGLPSGVEPLASGCAQRLPGGPADLSDHALPRISAEDRSPRLEQELANALGRLRKQHRAGETRPLGKLLDALVYEDLREATPLVLDAWALGDAGLTTTTPLALRPEPARHTDEHGVVFAGDLVFVPCRTALLLTTRAQVLATSGERPSFAAWDEAVADAYGFGHDSSGRFRRVDDWLEEEDALPVSGAICGFGDRLGTGGSEWEVAAGADDGSLLVVQRAVLPLVGLALAALLAAVAAAVCRPHAERRSRRFLLGWLAVSGLALLWLPPPLRSLAWWPSLAALLAALVWVVSHARGRVKAPRLAPPQATVVAALVLLALLAVVGRAAAPAPVTVFLVPDPDAPDKQLVLAPPELLDDLQKLTRRGVAGLREPVLLSALYEGRADSQTANFEGRYHVHCFADDPLTLTLPLGGVQLTEALLDGAAVQPLAVRQPREGYTLEVKGRGSHMLVVRFALPLPGTGEERDLRFTVPELVQSRLLLDVPASAGYLHAAEARGWQRTSSEDKHTRLEADLGSVGTVRIRWRRDGRQPRPAVVSVQEAYYWDLQASSARLLALLQYHVSKGWETNFKLDLPRELEVQAVEAGPLPGGPAAPRLRWLVKEEGGRRLHLEFQGPVTVGVQVLVVLVPRQPFGRTVTLPFPTPLDAQLGQGFLAYRSDGVEAAVANHHAITGIERDRLAKTFADSFAQPWKAVRQEDVPAPTRAFWRGKGGVLHLILRPPFSQVRAQQEIAWQVGPRQALLKASARLTAPDNGLSVLEWDVPGNLGIVEVTGPHVRSWSRSGGRLQVWLQKAVGDTTLQLSGWLPRGPRETGRFELPCLRFEAKSLATTLRITAGDGVALTPGPLTNLTARPDPGAGREWAYISDQDTYAGSFATRPDTAEAHVRLLTFAEVREKQLTVVATVDCQVVRGDLRHLTLAVRNWEGKDLRLDAPPFVRRREHLSGAGGPVWFLDLGPTASRHFQLTLTGSLPWTSAAEVLLPDVRVEALGPGVRLERWLAAAGPDVAAEETAGLTPATPDALRWWPGDAERLRRAGGSVWHIQGEDWRLRLRQRRGAERPAPVQVCLTEHTTALPDGQRWVSQATFRLFHEAGADLNVLLPEGAVVLAVTLDGTAVPPLQPGPGRLWLPLPGGCGGRVVHVTWALPSAAGDGSLPPLVLQGPRLEGVAEGPVVWTLHVPAGYDVAPRRRQPGAQPGSAAALDLWRASSYLYLLKQLVEHDTGGNDTALGAQVLAAQHGFERFARQAGYQVGRAGAAAGGPDGQSLAAWLQDLRTRYEELVKTHRLEPLRAEDLTPTASGAALFPFDLTPFDRGRPHYWQSVAGAAAPPVELLPLAANRERQALTWSTLLLVLLLALWIMAHFFRTAWPEQLALLGCVGAILYGPLLGTAFLALPLGWAGFRLAVAIRWGLRRLRPEVVREASTAA